MRGGIVEPGAAARHSPKGYDQSDIANVRVTRARLGPSFPNLSRPQHQE